MSSLFFLDIDRASRKKGSLFGQLCFLALVGMLAANAAATLLFAQASGANYPGGVALHKFNEHFASQEHGTRSSPSLPCIVHRSELLMPMVVGIAACVVHVHISNLAAQTGASLFLHEHAPPFHPAIGAPLHPGWVYDKTENLSLADLTKSRNVTHVIAEVAVEEEEEDRANAWTQVAFVNGFDGWWFHGAHALAQGRRGFTGLGSVLEMRRSAKLVVLERKRDGKTGA